MKVFSNYNLLFEPTLVKDVLKFAFIGMMVISCESASMPETNDFPVGEAIRVGPENFSSSFSYYNTTPESPDGKLIAYVKYLSVPVEERYEPVEAEIWVCDREGLSNHRKVVDIKMRGVHNGARLQWLNNNSFVYQDDKIRAISLDGSQLIEPVEGIVGHNPSQGKFLYAAIDEETALYSIFEYDVLNQAVLKLSDVRDYTEIERLFQTENLRPIEERKVLHLQYSPDGSKIAFRLDIGPSGEKDKHLVTQNMDGTDIRYFGPKPMHFAWFDNESIIGHDNHIADGMPDDRSGRRWDRQAKYVETVSGVGNHLAASNSRELFASESWYKQVPVLLKVFGKGEIEPIWQDTVSSDGNVTWTLGNHVNPAFSRDEKRLYFNKLSDNGLVQGYMVVLSE